MFTYGDFVSSQGFIAGKYLGKDEIKVGDNMEVFHVISDLTHKVKLYVPNDQESSLQKLPSKSSIQGSFKILARTEIIDAGEIEGSRFKYFSEKLATQKFKQLIEVYHDLCLLLRTKQITISEKKMLQPLEEKLVTEFSIVLEKDKQEVQDLLAGFNNEVINPN